MDGSGDLFIADSNDNVINEVNGSTGAVTVVAGGGNCDAQQNRQTWLPWRWRPGHGRHAELPRRPRVEGSGTDENLFIADTFDNVIREVDLSTGIIQTIAGNYTSELQES